MRPNKWLLGGSILICIIGVGTIVLPALLGKDGQIDGGRLNQSKLVADIGALALFSSPLIVVAGLCLWWRKDCRLSVAGLLAAAISLALTAWGNITDYLSWSRLPPPTDQMTYMAGFFAMLGSWVVCLAYGVFGFVRRFRRQ